MLDKMKSFMVYFIIGIVSFFMYAAAQLEKQQVIHLVIFYEDLPFCAHTKDFILQEVQPLLDAGLSKYVKFELLPYETDAVRDSTHSWTCNADRRTACSLGLFDYTKVKYPDHYHPNTECLGSTINYLRYFQDIFQKEIIDTDVKRCKLGDIGQNYPNSMKDKGIKLGSYYPYVNSTLKEEVGNFLNNLTTEILGVKDFKDNTFSIIKWQTENECLERSRNSAIDTNNLPSNILWVMVSTITLILLDCI
ncbi:uncharacterized protein LOC126881201 isoform X1 [Diabrotica virgifera virgifera]|uniref:GILT-like protein 1 n=1 Tax=Diabrotica virgifera virgifera TaxID=50390 RepID=A0ABM5JTJ4_DIAVI|nr:uncharacterized protein LOC126881201 isoform X1 [Diabrotica virgifera virgifera]